MLPPSMLKVLGWIPVCPYVHGRRFCYISSRAKLGSFAPLLLQHTASCILSCSGAGGSSHQEGLFRELVKVCLCRFDASPPNKVDLAGAINAKRWSVLQFSSKRYLALYRALMLDFVLFQYYILMFFICISAQAGKHYSFQSVCMPVW